MKETRILMGMPVTVEIVDSGATMAAMTTAVQSEIEKIFDYFTYIDEKFSTYKATSEIMAINRGELAVKDASEDMRTIFALAEETKQATDGYFDIKKPAPDGAPASGAVRDYYDPSGIVKGWAIWQAAKILERDGFANFYVDAGGDIQVQGTRNKRQGTGEQWSVGIRNPFKQEEIVKTLHVTGVGVATSGTYIRGDHIYNPKASAPELAAAANEVVSLTVIGPNVYEADRFATAAFAMGAAGISFIEALDGLEGYAIDKHGTATFTSGFEKYL